MINYQDGDYIIVETTKKHLVKVGTADPDESRGILESSMVSGEHEVIEFKAEHVLSNLGAKPKIGTVHGVKVEPWIKTFDTAVGECDVYYRPLDVKVFKHMIESEAEAMHDLLVKWKLHKLAPVQLELRLAKGKKLAQGMFSYGKGRGELDIIVCRPQDTYSMRFLLLHEFGHAIWSHCLRDDVKARWIKKYHSSVDVETFDGGLCLRLLEDMLAFEDMLPSEYGGQLEEEAEVSAYQNILGWIESNHGLREQDLNVLHRVGAEDMIRKVWPESVTNSDKRVLVSEYAKKNAEELWCDSLAYGKTGLIPEDIADMVERTLKAAR
jgi:hypothetical protein